MEKVLYFDCQMGVAGDMLCAALLELHPNPEAFLERMRALGIPGVEITTHRSIRSGVTGTRFNVTVHGAHEESHDVLSERSRTRP